MTKRNLDQTFEVLLHVLCVYGVDPTTPKLDRKKRPTDERTITYLKREVMRAWRQGLSPMLVTVNGRVVLVASTPSVPLKQESLIFLYGPGIKSELNRSVNATLIAASGISL